jgi:hypothetical protein
MAPRDTSLPRATQPSTDGVARQVTAGTIQSGEDHPLLHWQVRPLPYLQLKVRPTDTKGDSARSAPHTNTGPTNVQEIKQRQRQNRVCKTKFATIA